MRKDVSTLENARKLLISLAKDFPVFYGLGNHESKMKIEGYPCQSEYLEYEQSLRKAGGPHILTNEKYEFQAKGTSLVINGLELPLEYLSQANLPKAYRPGNGTAYGKTGAGRGKHSPRPQSQIRQNLFYTGAQT